MSNLNVGLKYNLNKTNKHFFFPLILSYPSKNYIEKCAPSLDLDLVLTHELQTTKSHSKFSRCVKSTSNILKIIICSSANTNQSGKNLKHIVVLRTNSVVLVLFPFQQVPFALHPVSQRWRN